VHRADVVRQTDIHTFELFVPELSASELEVPVGKLKSYKSPGVDQVAAELIQAGGETLRSEIRNLYSWCGTRKNSLSSGKSQLYLFIKRVVKLTLVIVEAYDCCQLHKHFSFILFCGRIPYADEIIRDHQCRFRCKRSTTNQMFCIHHILKKVGVIIQCVVCF
jgi:hypothetical protein